MEEMKEDADTWKTVEGPRGKLTKDLGHLAVSFSLPSKVRFHIYLRADAQSKQDTELDQH